MTVRIVHRCQLCEGTELERVLFLGYHVPVNAMPSAHDLPQAETSYPTELLRCPRCQLVQLGLVVDASVLFPRDYPYTSSTTRILRENFADLYRETASLLPLGADDLIVDVGSNDGNLLSNFQGRHRVLGITPEDVGQIAVARGIPTLFEYFGAAVVDRILATEGPAKVVTATNVFAHIDDVHAVTEQVVRLLGDDGVFISESHYLPSLMRTLQYDTVYHEHLRYYCLQSLRWLLERHGLEVFHAHEIPTHGGSVRVFAARPGRRPVQPSVLAMIESETQVVTPAGFRAFKAGVVTSKIQLYRLLSELRARGDIRIFGISAPSRASTLVQYVGLDDGIIDCVVEIAGSHKIGRTIPGTRIPVVEEKRLFEEQPSHALLLAWHIADELAPKLKSLGYRGDFIVPLPEPRVIRNADIA